MRKVSVGRQFARYVSQNILGTLGISAYILADTFFIAQSEGADGIAALNLVLPVYAVIYAIGAMLGVGSATRFAIDRAAGARDAQGGFTHALIWTGLLSLPFVAVGILAPDGLMRLLGGDERIVTVGAPYAQTFLLFTPFFMWNYVFSAFVRNDGDPSLAMAATLSSSLFNIVMDYVLMFPLGMGMVGAALATAISPVVGILICSLHFLKKSNTIRLCRMKPSLKMAFRACQVGVASFVGEISSGVTTLVFNFLLLEIAGSLAVAAYGVVANVALVATSLFSGISQGAQPLLSDFYGRGERASVQRVLRLSVGTALVMAVIVLLTAVLLSDPIVAAFNSEGDAAMASMARQGMQLYFIGFLFAGFNIAGTGYLSAIASARWAMITSLMRGVAAIVVCAVVLAILLGMTGIWLAFATAEAITALVMLHAIRSEQRRE
ncbi:MAG: polysaccharide biosynthesis C-terminal domain-containing protein [Clostridia bacterium]|nr:polysaccharide biosynthesis C-terminal domain-containing protein [Clostridia bacterium]